MIASPESCGFAAVHKPAGMSSAKATGIVRRRFGRKARAGHTGTLDPLATGLLVIALGPATRFIRYLPAAKRYRAAVRFGLSTATGDLEGVPVSEQKVPADLEARVRTAVAQFVGSIDQAAPAYSALKHKGKPLYAYARAGQEVDAKVRTVQIDAIEVLDVAAAGIALLDVRCGPGTYLRSLARDLGEAVGCPATLAHLCRTSCNGLELADAQQLDGDEPFQLVDIACMLELPRIPVSASKAAEMAKGSSILVACAMSGTVAVVTEDGTLVAMAACERAETRTSAYSDKSPAGAYRLRILRNMPAC